jgi:cysteine desulfurase / selenocysteine lyase
VKSVRTVDLDKVRADTPGCAGVLHFNNAGAALPPAPVVDAVVEHLRLEASIGGYEAAARAEPSVERVYTAAAELIGANRDEIAIMENATRGWAMAFYGIGFEPGDRILTSRAEYASNYIAYLQVSERTGASVEPIPNDEHGQLDVVALRDAVDERVKLIALTHVPTNGGLVNPAEEVGRIARDAGVLYLLDACQSAGQLDLDVERIGCDLLSATGRKYLRGPRGTGFLYVRASAMRRVRPPMLDLHSAAWTAPDRYELRPDARRFETWESAVAGKIGLGVAIDYALGVGLPGIERRVYDLAAELRTRLGAIPGVVVRDLGLRRCGIVTFTVDGMAASAVKSALAARRINVNVSDTGSTLLDMSDRGLAAVVRASVHYYNSEAEVDRFVEAISTLR